MRSKNSSMNKDLQEWILEEKNKIKDLKIEKKQNKKPKGLCQICGEKTAVSVCIKCGKSVCKKCHFKLISVCKKCIPAKVASKWDGSKPDWEKELGVEWVE